MPVRSTTTESGSGAINRDAIEKIRSLGGSSPNVFLEKVVRTYLETSPALVESLHSAATTGDSEKMADAAHTLKSSSASLGAERLAALCRKVEKLARAERTAKAAILVAALETEFGHIVDVLSSEYMVKTA